MVMVVKQPGVDVPFAQRSLDGGQVHGQTSIVNKVSDFGRIGPSTKAASRPPLVILFLAKTTQRELVPTLDDNRILLLFSLPASPLPAKSGAWSARTCRL